MVIVIGKWIGDPSSNPGRGCLPFALWKACANLLWLKSYGRLDSLALVRQSVLGEKLQIQTTCTPLNKLVLCRILLAAKELGKYMGSILGRVIL